MGSSVSVIIPTYNGAERLMHALDSVESQVYPHDLVEVLIIDDGSTDDTGARVEAFAGNSSIQIRYVRQDNAGPAAARNHGIRLARSDVIAFLDADDYWQPQKLELQIPLLAGPVALVYCDNSYVDAVGNPIDNYVRTIPLLRGDILLALFCEFFLLTSAVVLTKACIEAVGVFDEQLAVGEDYDFFLRVARLFQVDCVDRKLLVRCVRPDSLSRLDYALDARVDLATLTQFLQDNPDFALRNRASVNRRLARYRYEFGYRLLAQDRRAEAIKELWQSLRTHASLAATRTLVRALLSGTRK